MQKNNDMPVKKEFFLVTGILPLHLSNRPEERILRKDVIFQSLGEKVFDNPALLILLKKKMRRWLAAAKTEFCFSLAGYIYYIADEFDKAEKYFLKAITENPENLDNWFDLAFSLYHQSDKKHDLGKKILFNHDYCVRSFKDRIVDLRALSRVLRNKH